MEAFVGFDKERVEVGKVWRELRDKFCLILEILRLKWHCLIQAIGAIDKKYAGGMLSIAGASRLMINDANTSTMDIETVYQHLLPVISDRQTCF